MGTMSLGTRMTEQRLMEWRGNGKCFGPSFLVPFLLLQFDATFGKFGVLNNVQHQLVEPITLEYTSSNSMQSK